MSERFQVPKKKVNVTIAFDLKGNIVLEPYSIFLSEYSSKHRGEESLIEFLNEKSLFFPGVNRETNEFFLINSATVLFVLEETKIEEPVIDNITITFLNGENLMAGLDEILPTYRSRPLDYLNQEDVFISFIHQQSQIFINKHKIAKVSGL